MKTTLLAIALGLSIAACGKSDASPATTTTAAPAATTGATKPASAPAPAPAAAPAKPAFVQKGIPAGKVVVGYLQDKTDPNQCAVVTDAPNKKDQFAKDGAKLAEMMKAKVVTTCPTDNVVGTCDAGLGMLVNYSGPKWTAETAKKDCLSHPHQKWVD
jgi:hypothetical protein